MGPKSAKYGCSEWVLSDTKLANAWHGANWYSGLDYGLSGSSSATIVYPSMWKWTVTSSALGGQDSVQYAHYVQTPSISMQYYDHAAAVYQCQYNFHIGNLYKQPPETAEEKAARLEKVEQRKQAELRAETILKSCLSADQQKQFAQLGYFDTSVNQRVYRIRRGRSGNVELLDKGRPVYRYCAHPDLMVPEPDVMLAQMLMLKTDETRFLKIANRTVLGHPSDVDLSLGTPALEVRA